MDGRQTRQHLRRDRVRDELARRGDGLTELLDVGRAPVAAREVSIDPGSILIGEGTLEMVGCELDQLDAGELRLYRAHRGSIGSVGVTHSRHSPDGAAERYTSAASAR